MKLKDFEENIKKLSTQNIKEIISVCVEEMRTADKSNYDKLENMCQIAEKELVKRYMRTQPKFIKYVESMREVKKSLNDMIKYVEDYEIRVQIFSSYDKDKIYTDLNIDVYGEEEYIDTITIYAVEDGKQEENEKILEPYKKKVLTYLKKHYKNIISVVNDNQ